MLIRIANSVDSDPDQTGSERSDSFFSPIWVCTVCVGLFGRQLVSKILEHLYCKLVFRLLREYCKIYNCSLYWDCFK